jgi:hypothetical protein
MGMPLGATDFYGANPPMKTTTTLRGILRLSLTLSLTTYYCLQCLKCQR